MPNCALCTSDTTPDQTNSSSRSRSSSSRDASTPKKRSWRKRRLHLWLILSLACVLASAAPAHASSDATNDEEGVRHWSQVAVDTSGIDHTPVQPGETRKFGEQYGPTRASRAMAIVHIAIYEALNCIEPRYQSYVGVHPAAPISSKRAAVAQAAHDTLVALFPSQQPRLDDLLTQDLAAVTDAAYEKDLGIKVGQRAAAAILKLRANDGSDKAEPHIGVDFFPSDLPGKWREDPISQLTIALGAYWGEVTPFVMTSSQQFRVPPPPALTSAEYTQAYNEVKAIGGDGINTPTSRTQEQTDIGLYWAYDGTPSLCAPPRMYNQMALHIAQQMGTEGLDLARLLALAHTAMADAAIAVWESKFYYQEWRPVTGIRESDPGTGPTGLGDGNPDTIGDPTWSPLGAPASNITHGVNFTPPFPTYSSGHAGIGGAFFQVLTQFYGTDNVSFTFVSDELNGTTVDASGTVRPLLPRTFSSFSQAAEECGQSRIYLGIHWAFDKTRGLAQGRSVGNWVYSRAFQPLWRTGEP